MLLSAILWRDKFKHKQIWNWTRGQCWEQDVLKEMESWINSITSYQICDCLRIQVRPLPVKVLRSLAHSQEDVTLSFEDANSQLLDIFSVADVDAEERVNDNLIEILNLNLCQKISKIKFGFWSKFLVKSLWLRSGQDMKTWPSFWRCSPEKIFETEFYSTFWHWSLVWFEFG